MRRYESITIDHNIIHAADVQKFTAAWEGDPGLPDFLKAWYDDSDSFSAFTSGSTGKPTNVVLYKEYAEASARATIQYLGLSPGSNALLSMPAKYIAGRMMIIRALIGRFNLLTIPPASCPAIPDMPIELAAFTPHQFQNIIRSAVDITSLQINHVLLGGSPVPDNLIRGIDRFSGRIYETFGMTETYSHVAMRKRYPIEDDYFEAVGPTSFSDQDGKLQIQAPHLGIEDLQTNDVVELDGTRRFRWLGRADHVINSGGIKIHPESVESKLKASIPNPHFIAGQPDPVYGQRVVLVVQKVDNGLTESEILSRMDERLEKYEKPKSIVWVDTMMYTPTGKINRFQTLKHNQIT